jgi:S-adenosyl-L-methionine hydrolase (adenosine-forming)
MSRPVLALLSDFGLRDHYVGSMKAAALSVCPDLTLVDITHDIAPHDVLGGALQLAASFKFFPAGTVFVAVVDPGVGSTRRGIAAEAGEYRFVAPDNGLLTAVLHDMPPKRIVELTERRYFRPTVSRTFEGRDRFAPAAAWLLRGIDLTALGRPIHDPVLLDLPRPAVQGDELHGRIVQEDHFGNLITNIDRRTFEKFLATRSSTASPSRFAAPASPARAQSTARRAFTITVSEITISRVVATYAEIPDDEVCGLFGSSDHLELAARSAKAAARLGLGAGASVVVRRGE